MTEARYFDAMDSEWFHHQALEEAVIEYLEEVDPEIWETEIEVIEYRNKDFTDQQVIRIADNILEQTLENFDEEHGDPDNEAEVTDAMRDAAMTFARVFRAEYKMFACEKVRTHEVNVFEWLDNNVDDMEKWLANSAGCAPVFGEDGRLVAIAGIGQ